jgi:uncharacterized protein YjbI with pentapeptide repeats
VSPGGGYGDGVRQEERSFAGDDWWGEDLADRVYLRCRFADVDLTEATSHGARFEECQFFNVRFNSGRHADSAFLRCTFRKCNLFDTTWEGCKLVGSTFDDCDLRPMTVTAGDWSFVHLAGADLRTAVFRDVRMREAELTGANLTGAVLSRVDLSGAQLHKAKLLEADLRGSDLTALDPRTCETAGAIIDPDQAIVIARAIGFTLG